MKHPWWWTFTDVELSMIASHLAAGGSFCCKANADARELVTTSEIKQELLAEHAYERWGCYDGGYDKLAGRGNGSRAFAGVGPYLRSTGVEYSAAETERQRQWELEQAGHYFKKFMEDVSPRFAWLTLERYNTAKRNADNTFKAIDALAALVERSNSRVN